MYSDTLDSAEAPSPDPPRPRLDAYTLLLFAGTTLLVAGNVVAVRITNQELPPFWGAGTRFGTASLLFLAFVVLKRLPLPRGRVLIGVLLFGILQFGLGFALAYRALLDVPAGLMSVVLALVPLFTLLAAFAVRQESLRWQSVAGALLALLGSPISLASARAAAFHP